jgi:hypothetical protein
MQLHPRPGAELGWAEKEAFSNGSLLEDSAVELLPLRVFAREQPGDRATQTARPTTSGLSAPTPSSAAVRIVAELRRRSVMHFSLKAPRGSSKTGFQRACAISTESAERSRFAVSGANPQDTAARATNLL